jgi:hypothetical protein
MVATERVPEARSIVEVTFLVNGQDSGANFIKKEAVTAFRFPPVTRMSEWR